MTGFQNKDGVLHADDVPLPRLAAHYGTPVYVYSGGRIRQNVLRLQHALEKTLPVDRQPLIAYACKANSNLAILTLLRKMGLGCDVVSGGELLRALRAGISPDNIVYSGVGKSDEEITAALENNLLQINVESGNELERIAELAARQNVTARITFRLNPDVTAGTHDKISTGRSEDKFGMTRAQIEELYPWAAAHDYLAPQGLHMHIGSQITDMAPFRAAYEKLADFADALKAKDLPLDMLDIGGGLGIVYQDENPPDLDAYAQIIRDTILPLDTRIVLEPGRFITGDAGVLLTRASYIKENKVKRYVVLDAGMNDLIRPTLYDAYHAVRAVESRGGEESPYDIVGPVCETGDTFIKNHSLPEIRKGDLLAIMCAGAYGAVMASNYNTRPLPAEILVDGDHYTIIRQKQSIQDIMDREQVPEWL